MENPGVEEDPEVEEDEQLEVEEGGGLEVFDKTDPDGAPSSDQIPPPQVYKLVKCLVSCQCSAPVGVLI